MLDDKTLLKEAKKRFDDKIVDNILKNKELKVAFKKAIESKKQANEDWLMFTYELDKVNHRGLWGEF